MRVKIFSHRPILKCLLILHNLKPGAQEVTAPAASVLRSKGLQVDEIGHDELCNLATNHGYDFALVFGGDGLSLLVGRSLAPLSIPVLAVNLGRVGFMTGFSYDNWEKAIDDLILGKLFIRDHDTLTCSLSSHQNESYLALNELFFAGQSRFRICEFDVFLDEQVSLGHFRGDGLMLATPTGSTAYALSCGGPIIAPDLQAILLLSVNPYAIAYRPMVISGKSNLRVRLAAGNRYPVILVRDGQELEVFSPEDEASITLSEFPAQFLYPQDHSFYQRVCDKIGWHASIFEGESRI